MNFSMLKSFTWAEEIFKETEENSDSDESLNFSKFVGLTLTFNGSDWIFF